VSKRSPRSRARLPVPVEVGSFLRAPYGWTNRMRRAEGWPERGARGSVRIGFWRNAGMGVALYGGPIAGAVVGWHVADGLLGAVIGMVLGAGLGMALAVLALAPWSRLVQRGKHS
jgi:hypothetical protein